MRILRLLWEIIFPFEIVRLTPKQQALRKLAQTRCRRPIKMETKQAPSASRTQDLMAVEEVRVLESPSESQVGSAPGKRLVARTAALE